MAVTLDNIKETIEHAVRSGDIFSRYLDAIGDTDAYYKVEVKVDSSLTLWRDQLRKQLSHFDEWELHTKHLCLDGTERPPFSTRIFSATVHHGLNGWMVTMAVGRSLRNIVTTPDYCTVEIVDPAAEAAYKTGDGMHLRFPDIVDILKNMSPPESHRVAYGWLEVEGALPTPGGFVTETEWRSKVRLWRIVDDIRTVSCGTLALHVMPFSVKVWVNAVPKRRDELLSAEPSQPYAIPSSRYYELPWPLPNSLSTCDDCGAPVVGHALKCSYCSDREVRIRTAWKDAGGDMKSMPSLDVLAALLNNASSKTGEE